MTGREALQELRDRNKSGDKTILYDAIESDLDKQIAQPIKEEYLEHTETVIYKCPRCEETLFNYEYFHRYCHRCGQRITWRDK